MGKYRANWKPEKKIHYSSVCSTRYHYANSAHHNEHKIPPKSMILEQRLLCENI